MALKLSKAKEKQETEKLNAEKYQGQEENNSVIDAIKGLEKLDPQKPVPKPVPKKDTAEKNKGGRPKKEETQKRKQYSLTLLPSTYEKFLYAAHVEGKSFAQLIEQAMFEYIHRNPRLALQETQELQEI